MEKEQRRPYWTFEGIKLHLKDGSVAEDEELSSFTITDGAPLYLPRKNYGSKRKVMEEVHDFLYNNIALGPKIRWVELLNIKEYK